MESLLVADARRAAEDFFSSGLFCAESVVMALAKVQGIESEHLPSVATAFCSGMARTCGTCGALTGAMMGIGLALGRSGANAEVQPAYTATQSLISRFEMEFGSRDCKPLLSGCDLASPEGQMMFREQKLGVRCRAFTGRATEIAASLILENKAQD